MTPQENDFVKVTASWVPGGVQPGIVIEVLPHAAIRVMATSGFVYALVRGEYERIAPFTPPGTALAYFDDPIAQSGLRLVCDGADRALGYRCSKAPGHTGRCWSSSKHVEFFRESEE